MSQRQNKHKAIFPFLPLDKDSWQWLASRKGVYHLLILFLIILGINLGFWQLERADEKALMLEEIRQGQQNPLPWQAFLTREQGAVSKTAQQEFGHFVIMGQYHPQRSFLLDNRTHQGRVGYHLLTPFEILPFKTTSVKYQDTAKDSPASSANVQTADKWLLINRGWIPAPRLRSDLPIFDTPKGLVQLQVQLKHLPPTMNLPETPILKWPLRIQQISLIQAASQLPTTLYPYEFRLIDADQPGVQVAKPTQPALQPEQHIGYAVQWFALAATFFALWFWRSCHFFFRQREEQ